MSFNSLQTGKAFRTRWGRGNRSHREFSVSIPFKRERLSEHCLSNFTDFFFVSVSIPFKRERLSELLKIGFGKVVTTNVSIPFKRERLSEHGNYHFFCGSGFCFNSLQTGKAFRTIATHPPRYDLSCFNSLQTGKAFRTPMTEFRDGFFDSFQFPSNGKGFPNQS